MKIYAKEQTATLYDMGQHNPKVSNRLQVPGSGRNPKIL